MGSFARLLAVRVVFEVEKPRRQLEMLEVAFFDKAEPTCKKRQTPSNMMSVLG